jgi:hypothetical protein
MGDKPGAQPLEYSSQGVQNNQNPSPNPVNPYMPYSFPTQYPQPYYNYPPYQPPNTAALNGQSPQQTHQGPSSQIYTSNIQTTNPQQNQSDPNSKIVQPQTSSIQGYPPNNFPYPPYYSPQWQMNNNMQQPPINNNMQQPVMNNNMQQPPMNNNMQQTGAITPVMGGGDSTPTQQTSHVPVQYPQGQPWVPGPYYPPTGAGFFGPYPPYPYPMNYPAYPYPMPFYNMMPPYMMGSPSHNISAGQIGMQAPANQMTSTGSQQIPVGGVQQMQAGGAQQMSAQQMTAQQMSAQQMTMQQMQNGGAQQIGSNQMTAQQPQMGGAQSMQVGGTQAMQMGGAPQMQTGGPQQFGGAQQMAGFGLQQMNAGGTQQSNMGGAQQMNSGMPQQMHAGGTQQMAAMGAQQMGGGTQQLAGVGAQQIQPAGGAQMMAAGGLQQMNPSVQQQTHQQIQPPAQQMLPNAHQMYPQSFGAVYNGHGLSNPNPNGGIQSYQQLFGGSGQQLNGSPQTGSANNSNIYSNSDPSDGRQLHNQSNNNSNLYPNNRNLNVGVVGPNTNLVSPGIKVSDGNTADERLIAEKISKLTLQVGGNGNSTGSEAFTFGSNLQMSPQPMSSNKNNNNNNLYQNNNNLISPPPKLGIYPVSQTGKMITSSVRNEEEDVDYFCEENIPFLQEYIRKFEQLKEKGERFTDEEFPPQARSLMDLMHSTKSVSWSGLEWLRPEEFFNTSDYKIFQKPETFEMEGSKYSLPLIEPDDIKQGELGNCYFLATLSSLAEWPKRVKRLFITRKKNNQGIYAVKMNHYGEWRAVIMDDYFPCYNRKRGPAFTKGNGNELWVLLLEKAWAKLYGSYERIEAGLTREALRDLTGAPTKVIFSDDKNLWSEITTGERENYIMTAGANEEEDLSRSTQDRLGLVASHAYSLVSVHEVKAGDGEKVKLVKLRNPWGDKEWKGKWSDESTVWTEDLRKMLNYKQYNRRDGTFFMDFEDFKKYFSDIQLCLYKDSHQYTSFRTKCRNNKAEYITMTVYQPGQYYITINQESKRKYDRNSPYKYSMARIVIGKFEENGSFIFMGAKQKSDKEVWTSNDNFAPGRYAIHIKMDWFDKVEREVVLSAYGAGKVHFERSKKAEGVGFLEKVYIGRGRQNVKRKNYGKYGLPEVEKAVELFEDEGIGYFYLQNRSSKKFRTTVTFTKMEGLKLRKPHKGNVIEISADPGMEKLATLTVSYKGYSLSYTESIKF